MANYIYHFAVLIKFNTETPYRVATIADAD